MRITYIGYKRYLRYYDCKDGSYFVISLNFIDKVKQYFKSRKCKGRHEFEGAYMARAKGVEMRCKKCNGLNFWTYEEWEKTQE